MIKRKWEGLSPSKSFPHAVCGTSIGLKSLLGALQLSCFDRDGVSKREVILAKLQFCIKKVCGKKFWVGYKRLTVFFFLTQNKAVKASGLHLPSAWYSLYQADMVVIWQDFESDTAIFKYLQFNRASYVNSSNVYKTKNAHRREGLWAIKNNCLPFIGYEMVTLFLEQFKWHFCN